MPENSRSFMFKNTRLYHWHLLHRCYLVLLGLSFSTHSPILFSSEYFHYKIFIHEKMLRKLKVWHVDKYKITFKLVISHWTNEITFSTHSRILFSSEYFHYKIFIHEKMLRKLKWQIPGEPLAVRYNWCQGPLLGRGPAVEKHWRRRLQNN